jgi:general secretion pathway protein I
LRGFTLLEVMVALGIVAVALGAIIQAAGGAANTVGALRTRTVAGWVALNATNTLLLEPEWPAEGKREGKTEMAGQEWHWQVQIKTAPGDKDFRRLEAQVYLGRGVEPLTSLVATRRRDEAAGLQGDRPGLSPSGGKDSKRAGSN